MFEHYLLNKNECATVAPKSKFRELNKGLTNLCMIFVWLTLFCLQIRQRSKRAILVWSIVRISGVVRLTPYSACLASFFSRNSVFFSQQFSRNNIFQSEPSFRPANGTWLQVKKEGVDQASFGALPLSGTNKIFNMLHITNTCCKSHF